MIRKWISSLMVMGLLLQCQMPVMALDHSTSHGSEKSQEQAEVSLKLHTHNNWKVSYIWSEDHTTCTAIAECREQNCSAVMVETVDVTKQGSHEAALFNKEKVTYTACFSSEWARTQTCTVEQKTMAESRVSSIELLDQKNKSRQRDRNGNDLTIALMVKESGEFYFTVNSLQDSFLEVQVDQKVVQPEFYTVQGEQIEIGFSESFINTLNRGKHDLQIITDQGDAEVQFKIDRRSLKEKRNYSMLLPGSGSRFIHAVIVCGVFLLLICCGGIVLLCLKSHRKKSVID